MLFKFDLEVSESFIDLISKEKNEYKDITQYRRAALKKYKSLPESKYIYGKGISGSVKPIDLTLAYEKPHKFLLPIVNEGVILNTFDSLSTTFKKYIDQFFTEELQNQKNKDILLHLAVWDQSIFLFIPKEKILHDPIIIDIINLNQKNFTNLLIISEENSEATIVINNKNNNSNKYSSLFVKLFAYRNSKINLINMSKFENFNYHNCDIGIIQNKNSIVNVINIGLNIEVLKINIINILREPNSEANIFSFNNSIKSQKYDLDFTIVQEAEATKSNMSAINIMEDNSKLIFKGLIKIEETAVNSIGYQREENLLLGENAEVFPIPKLEIKNNDVKCYHSASTSNIDLDKIFYLMSRGLSEDQARSLIIQSYYIKFIDILPNNQIKKIIKPIILSKYNEINV